MALKGHVFNKQLFTSECFALFIDTFLDKNSGIVNGCGISNTTSSISIASGFFCVKGRFLQEEGGTTFNIDASTQDDIYCRLVCEIDLSKENTTSELKQAQYKILQSTSNYTTLLQEDTTNGGTIYQFEFAQFNVTENGIENFVDKRTFLNFNSIYGEIRTNINTFLSEQKITTKEQIDTLITDLQTYCDTAKEVLTDDVVMNMINLINTKADKTYVDEKTLTVANWIQNETTGYYEYNVTDESITASHLVQGNMDLANQAKMTERIYRKL